MLRPRFGKTFLSLSHPLVSVWTPDAKTIYFGSNGKGSMHVYAKAADGSGPEQVVLEEDAFDWPTCRPTRNILCTCAPRPIATRALCCGLCHCSAASAGLFPLCRAPSILWRLRWLQTANRWPTNATKFKKIGKRAESLAEKKTNSQFG